MLRVYYETIELVRVMRPVIAEVQKRDPDLADQLRRALQSIPLNTAEGQGSRGRNRAVRYSTALGSARETIASLDVAEAFGYVDDLAEPRAMLDRICAALFSLAR